MHPPLHTKDNRGCEEVMLALEECHTRGFLTRMLGGCNDAKRAVNRCLRQERLLRTKENHEKSRAKNEKIQKLWEEVDASS